MQKLDSELIAEAMEVDKYSQEELRGLSEDLAKRFKQEIEKTDGLSAELSDYRIKLQQERDAHAETRAGKIKECQDALDEASLAAGVAEDEKNEAVHQLASARRSHGEELERAYANEDTMRAEHGADTAKFRAALGPFLQRPDSCLSVFGVDAYQYAKDCFVSFGGDGDSLPAPSPAKK